jgi:carbonic anhydrase
VLGHTHCGAVIAALDTRLHGTRQASRIQHLVDCILPGIADLDARLTPEEMLAQAVRANVRWSMRQILESPEGRERQVEGSMKLIGAIYDIETGRVQFLE